jgi:SAM-dependent methyltransferase
MNTNFWPLSTLKRSLSRETKIALHYRWIKLRYALDFGRAVECPVCGRVGSSFATFNGRRNAMCPSCFSLERHRLLYLYLRDRTQVFAGKMRVLHFAPEKCLATKLRGALGANYVTADNMQQFIPLIEVRPDRIMSITDIQEPAQSCDVLICSHVLEHVDDDRRAMREIYRVVKKGGCALLMVPINRDAAETLEDRSLNEDERRRQYGSPHHLRYYAEADFVKRLAQAGFSVDCDHYVKTLAVDRYVLDAGDVVYRCAK